MSDYIVSAGVPKKILDAAPAAGFGDKFAILLYPRAEGRFTFHAIGTFTVCTVDLLISLDGGTTFSKLGTTMDFAAARPNVRNDVVPGALYQLEVKTFTGTSVTI